MRIRLQLPFAAVALPPASLAGSIRAYITKDTSGSPRKGESINRYPASVYCGIAWFLEGSSERVEPGLPSLQPLPSTLLLGPQTRPWVTRNPGPVRTFGVVFYPQAFHRLTGLDISTLVDGMFPVHGVLPPDWIALCEQVRLAPDDTARMALLEAFVARHAHALQTSAPSVRATATRWLHELQVHASAQGLGGSLRSLERHARTWAGQSLRRLGWLSRAETTLMQARQRSEASGQAPRWQDVALDAGYADQSHLCREAQRVTGESPAELARRVQSEDESYWLYRLWT
ncbi:AraC-like DNA-binding protein [Acidovorax sp. 93]|jgi:AraC-like DNA-binding protein|uniref:helix-turn-helix domain-containing protein n=1 Tax=Acidovorax sp. 93 TaxID=2135632 RepID=UPI000EB5EDFE|nr:helix-turn-helix domain-containing protein [Acidovorax sp. 93]RKR26249.1 AraC-like DNA-binding protein [Acidovorax sp. 93]